MTERDTASLLSGSPGGDPPTGPVPTEATTTRRERRRGRRRERRSRRVLGVLVAVAVVLVLLGALGAVAAVRLSAPDPPPAISPVLARSVDVPPATVNLPWPGSGQGAVAVPSVGIAAGSEAQKPVPIASLTKLMTAYIVLHDHPLIGFSSGPSVAVTEADLVDYDADTVNNDSSALVAPGEVLTERQLLDGLLVHSADNYADMLAGWDAGSIPAFVAKMNAVAAQLGMKETHFADDSGVAPGSESTASDILKVASPDMENPVFASMVLMPSVTLPVAGTISTYTPLLGLDGIIGVKSGFTSQAGGCDVLAVVRTVHGVPTLVIAAVTGQEGAGALVTAGLHALDLADTVAKDIGTTPALQRGQVVARVTEDGAAVDARAVSSVTMLTWPGDAVARRFEPVTRLTDRARHGDRVGMVVVSLGSQRAAVPVLLSENVPRPSWTQRLF